MRLLVVESSEFAQRIANPLHVFNSVEFSEHNREKCESLYYFIWENDSGACLGLIAGQRGSQLFSPFSAPCGGFSPVGSLGESQIGEAVGLLIEWLRASHKSMVLFPPPHCYSPQFLESSLHALKQGGFRVEVEELNQQIPLTNFEAYWKSLWRIGRKNLKTAEAENLCFVELPLTSFARVYEVIRENRISRQKPLRMTLEELESTSHVIDIKLFIVTKENEDVAAAIVFHVAPGIAQVIYWGDRPVYSAYRSMNFLAAKVVQHYIEQKFQWLDIGISSVDGVRDEGLCNFKESVGCTIESKFKLVFEP